MWSPPLGGWLFHPLYTPPPPSPLKPHGDLLHPGCYLGNGSRTQSPSDGPTMYVSDNKVRMYLALIECRLVFSLSSFLTLMLWSLSGHWNLHCVNFKIVSPVELKEKSMSCRLYLFSYQYAPCLFLILRNDHVTLSNLRVKGQGSLMKQNNRDAISSLLQG